ncbi:MAG TPA: protein kinase [Pyrinomonadaceae bacterium]|nr:protein kinase [Pyrinomonadaceae bacterium]
MSAENWPLVKAILDEVLDLAPPERAIFLDAGGLKPEIRAEVDALLAFEDDAQGLMQLSAVEFAKNFIDDDESDMSGQTVGAYRIVRELGHGGMGAVYLAERTDGKFTQRVALKLLKREMNTSALRRHFEQEREILASLEHPNIARLLDAGTTEDRVPFIAMEYVDGLPIGEYCRVKNLDLNARLELFRTVCGAVDYAHQNLIVHRDLKPSNVMVTHDGVPKLLDFGISKILSKGIDDADSATITRMGLMTPSYASPEQLQKKSVTTLSDVYSLGVILFEMLSGHRPFESKENDLREIYSAVIEHEPMLPSSVIDRHTGEMTSEPYAKSVPGNVTEPVNVRHTGPTSWTLSAGSVRGDLDNIVLKAMRKEPERRYSSAGNLAEDIRRHLNGLTVTARPNTFSYRVTKFVGRNRLGVLAAAVILLAVVGGVGTTLWQARVASAERSRAEKRFNDVRKLANSYLFDVYPEIENLEGSLKAREAIVKNALEYLDSLSAEAGSDLELQAELATAYEKVGDVQGALNNSSLGNTHAGLISYEKARRLRESVLAASPADIEAKEQLANNYYVSARTLWNNSQTNEATEMFESGLKLRRQLAAAQPDLVEAKNRLAVLLIDYAAIPNFNNQAEKALALYNEAFTIISDLRSRDPENPDLKKSLTRLIRSQSQAKATLGDFDGAIAELNMAVGVSQELAVQFPKDFRVQRAAWLTESIICEVYVNNSKTEKSVDVCAKTIDFPAKALAHEPENGVVAYDLAVSHFNLARAYRLEGDLPRSIASGDRAVEVMAALSAKEPENNEYKRNIAAYETEIGRGEIGLARYDQAAERLARAIKTLIPIVANDPGTTTYLYDLGLAHRLLAQALNKKGDRPGALEHIDEAIAIVAELKAKNSLRDADGDLNTELENEKLTYTK